MIKIYTPENWRSYFNKYPQIIIDEGFIYSEESYQKLIKEPIGKLDMESGFIYGEDYLDFLAEPIGLFKEEGSEIQVFGDDYYKLNAIPILHVKDNMIFTREENLKMFGMPDFIIENEGEKGPSSIVGTNNDKATQSDNQSDNQKDEDKNISAAPIGGVAVGLLIVFTIASIYLWLSGEMFDTFSSLELGIVIGPVLVSGIIAFFVMRGISVIWFTAIVSGLLSWGVAAVVDLITDGFSFIWILTDLLFGWLVAIPFSFLPALIISVIIMLLQRVFKS